MKKDELIEIASVQCYQRLAQGVRKYSPVRGPIEFSFSPQPDYMHLAKKGQNWEELKEPLGRPTTDRRGEARRGHQL